MRLSGTILAPAGGVKRSLWIIFALLAILAALALFQSADQDDVLASAVQPPLPTLPDVTVREDFVTVSVPAPPATRATGTRRQASRPAPAGPTARPGAPVELPPSTRSASSGDGDGKGFFDRARRAFVGDGRHRPEPFPRVRDNE